MPLVAWGALAYALGLFLGITAPVRVSVIIMVASLGGTLVLVRRRSHPRQSWRVATAALVAAGVLVGASEAQETTSCALRLSRRAHLTARFDAPARPGAVASAVVGDGQCSARASLLMRRGNARPGDRATVTGVASVDARGLFLADAELTDVQRERSLAVLRGRIGARIDRLFGEDAPIVRALVIADMSLIPVEQRDRFARAGLVHMLSVSGLHVAIIALALELLAGVLRVPSRAARIATLVFLATYVAGIGAPAPAVRAAVMLAMLVASRMLQRPTSPWAILAVGGVAPLVQPRTVIDLGWQLSVAGTVALIAGGVLAQRTLPRRWRGVKRSLGRAALISIVATLVTAPLVAWTFGRISIVGPLTNLVADPVMGLLQPLLFLAIVIPIGVVERIAVDASHVLLLLFDGAASYAARLPGAAPIVLPTAFGAVMAAIAAASLLRACVAEHPTRAILVGLTSLTLLLGQPLLPAPRSDTELHMLDVGQGDAFAIRTRRNHWVVIDAGRSWANGDAGRSTVVPYLAHRGGDLVLFVLSHPHADHVGGAASLFQSLHPARFLDPGYVGTTPPYRAALAEAQREHIPWQRVHPGDSLVIDEVVLRALAPDSAWAASLADANLASTILLVRIGTVRILLTGDAEIPEEDWLLERYGDSLAADVLKVAHHGSGTSTSDAFLRAVHPRLALVSVGVRNSYGHPDPIVLERLRVAGAQTLRTDIAGTVVVHTDGRRLEAEVHGSRWTIPDRVLIP